MPSDRKPSTDQVLTNTFMRLRVAGALGVALGDVDALDAERHGEPAPIRRGFAGSAASIAEIAGDVDAAPA